MAEHFAAERIAGTDAPQRSRDCSRFACLLKELATDAIRFVPQQRVAAMVRQWLSKATSPEENVETLIDATALASFLALFAPAASGATAVDRLTRQRGTFTREQQAATAALRQSRFRVMRVESSEAARCFGVKDLASDEKLHVEDDHLPLDCIGAVLAGRTAPFDATTHVLIGPVIRLEASGLDAALACAHLGGKGLGSSQRYAEAIYRHAVRHGPLDALGQDEADTLPFGPADSALDALAFAWAERSGDVPPQNEEIRQARRLTSIDTLLEALVASVAARERRRGRLADAYARLAEIQIEVIQSRCMVGMSGPTLAAVGAAIAHAVVAERAAGRVRALFEELRERIRFAPNRRAAANGMQQERVIQRIQSLRAKTVAQGCTEQEALAAAEKVAELLDRYGLSLSELELRRQTCEGVGVETGRRRLAPLDDCVSSIAAFFDCHCWCEELPSGVWRHVFFGLRSDVEAARYLYALVDGAFATEAARFAAGELYRELDTGKRRSATRSFQIGLGRGICDKLEILRKAREAGLRRGSGRDLVPVKASVVESELDRLGLSFHGRAHASRRTVLRDAYAAGNAAGRRFEYRPGLAAAE